MSHQHDVLRRLLLAQILEADLQAQAVVLETLNTSLYHCQLELQREVRPGCREGGAAEEAQTGAALCRPRAWTSPRTLGKAAIQIYLLENDSGKPGETVPDEAC